MKPEDFFEIVPTPDGFQFRRFNLYRIFYVEIAVKHQASFAAQDGQAVSRSPALQALRAIPHCLVALARLLRLGFASRNRPRILFYEQGGRLSNVGGKTYDLYAPNIIASRGRENFILYQDRRDHPHKMYAPDLLREDFLPLFAFFLMLTRLLLGGEIRAFAARILKQYPGLPYDQRSASAVVTRFYAQYLLSRFLLRALRPSQVIMLVHYTREGFIAACKTLGCPVTELMHGRITPSHAFYNLPPAYATPAGRALLPDRILVYGRYWKEILLRGNFLPSEAIGVIGYYLKVPERRNERLPDGRRLILVATQFTIQETFCDYLAFLKQRLDRRGWLILIKPHTFEQPDAYRALEEPDFVEVTFENIYHLLDRADILIGSYSTVLYEGVRYRCANYALYNQPFEASWREFVDSGLFYPLHPGELPEIKPRPFENVAYYFDSFHPEAILAS